MTKSEDFRDAMILGAAARAITDRSMAAVQSPETPSAPPATALSALRHFLDGDTLDQPRNVLGLPHFEAARLVDRWAEDRPPVAGEAVLGAGERLTVPSNESQRNAPIQPVPDGGLMVVVTVPQCRWTC